MARAVPRRRDRREGPEVRLAGAVERLEGDEQVRHREHDKQHEEEEREQSHQQDRAEHVQTAQEAEGPVEEQEDRKGEHPFGTGSMKARTALPSYTGGRWNSIR